MDNDFNPDDIWLETMGKWGNFTIGQQRRIYRILLVSAVGASYLIDTVLLVLFALAGTVSLQVPLIFGLAALGHVVIFASLHWTGLSERFSNPHLTTFQMGYGLMVQLIGMAIAPQIAPLFLAIIFIIFGFGTLRITVREAFTAWFIACLSIGALFSLFRPSSIGIQAPSPTELTLIWIAFSLILLRTIGLGYYAMLLRIRMHEKAHSLIDAVIKAERLATHDSLTEALTRRAIIPAIDEQINLCKRKGIPACLAILDLDRFKALNDNQGHLAGDLILKDLVKRIEASIRDSDKLGRYGGEEFILLLPATTIDHGTSMVERIRQDVSASSWHGLPDGTSVTISCGITELRPDDLSVDAIERADLAMYDAKHKGRNQVCVYLQPSAENSEHGIAGMALGDAQPSACFKSLA
jgi:diguanylate cyclase (GGDEF)-like protein